MLCVEVLVDCFVELFVGTGRLGRVQIAAARNVAIGRIEVQRACYRIEILKR